MEIVVPSPAAIRRAAIDWLVANRIEIAVVLVLMVAAAVPRFVLLESIPPGLHGDEGITGMRVDAILHGEGWIGVFDSNHALGQPAGGEYWTAAIVKVFGNSVTTLRLSMALLGVITIPVAYGFFRLAGNRTLAVIATILLAFSEWHLHYSRIALPPVSMPLFTAATGLTLLAALRWREWWLFGLAGVCFGLGIYTYNAYPVFGFAVAAFLGLWLYTHRPEWNQTLIAQIALFGAVGLVVMTPMFAYANDHSKAYFTIARRDSLFNTPRYESSSNVLDKSDVILDAGRDYVRAAVFTSYTDRVDASGHRPILDPVFAVLLAIGALMALRKWRDPGPAFALAVLFVLPWAGIFTVGGAFRRTLGLVPYVSFLAALPLAYAWDRGWSERARLAAWAKYAPVAVVLTLSAFVAINVQSYFFDFRYEYLSRWVFVGDLAQASRYLEEEPDGTYVLFYNARHSFNYETRQYLAPDVEGEDRSNEFGRYDLETDRRRNTLYMFFPPYVERLDDVMRLYPGGVERTERSDRTGEVVYATYYLPGDPNAPPPAPPPPPPGGEERDATRLADLSVVQGALEAYRQQHGSYPDSGGAIQSLCVFDDLDAGCALHEVLNPLPQEPLGTPAINGYWYISDGTTYHVYAQREASSVPACADHPSHLANFASIMCVSGPAP